MLRPRYLKLASLYFLLYANLGAFVAYWPPYFKDKGFSSAEVGGLIAAGFVSRTIAPYIFGYLADVSGKSIRVMGVSSVLSLLVFSLSFVADSYLFNLAIVFIFLFFWASLLPQTDALVLANLRKFSDQYSLLRLWGSVGFIVSVVGCAFLLDIFGYISVLWMIFLCSVLTCIAIPFIKEGAVTTEQSAPIRGLLSRPEIILLLCICFLTQLAHSPYYTFFTIYMQKQDYGNTTISYLWAVAVIAEITIFLFAYKLLAGIGAITLLIWSGALTILRWLLTALVPDYTIVMLLTQTLHAASFGIHHMATIALIKKWFPGRLQGRGQALYASLGFGLGGALGSYITGLLWDSWGGRIYLVAALVMVCALILTIIMARLPMGSKLSRVSPSTS